METNTAWAAVQTTGLNAESAWRLIREAMQGLKSGLVTLTVRDGQLIQVDRAAGNSARRVGLLG
jgi:hypothetical protein